VLLHLQESIVNHVEYTMARSRYRFDDFECYQVPGGLKFCMPEMVKRDCTV
jgi:hypothetical protein